MKEIPSENLSPKSSPLPAKRIRKPRFPKLARAHSLHELIPLIASSNTEIRVSIHKEAYLMMSLHSHLYHHEVIG